MSSAKPSSAKPVATLASATAQTQSVIEGLQARLNGEVRTEAQAHVPSISISKARNVIEAQETEEDLERQLQAYFASSCVRPANLSRTQILDELRSRVVDGVVHRILAEWARREQELPGSAAMGNEIMERLIQRVFEQFQELAVAS